MASSAASNEHRMDMTDEELEPALWWPECCIYEVPENLRKWNPEAYAPQLISIGPLHRKQEKLKPMEKQKKLYYHYFQRRLFNSQHKALTDYKTFLESRENHIRRCYSKKCDIPKDEFVKMILLDSIFIMELFLRNSSNHFERKNDLLFSKIWIAGGILRDLLLLDNQVPMFVLVQLYNNVVPGFDKQRDQSFHELACDYFAALNHSFHQDYISEERLQMYKKSEHFIDLIRYFCLPNDPENYFNPGKSGSSDLKTARKLKEAGISFKWIKIGALLAIKFKKEKFLDTFPWLRTIPGIKIFKSVLLIPQLIVDDGTESLLRNLMALEQCHYPMDAYVCNYVALMDSLIDTKEDVDFLIEKQIIVKNVGSNKEVATMLNGLCKEVHMSSSCYAEIIERLNRHYDNRWNHTMAKLKSVYFCDLWRGSATVVGVAVFLFSIVDIVRAFM